MGDWTGQNVLRLRRIAFWQQWGASLLFPCVLIVALFGCGASNGADVEASDREAVQVFAQEKFRGRFGFGAPGSTDRLELECCRSITLRLPPYICGEKMTNPPLYDVGVVKISGELVRDVVALSIRGPAYSVMDSGGMARLVEQSGVSCDSGEQFMELVRLDLDIHYDLEHAKESIACDALRGSRSVCQPITYRELEGGFESKVWVRVQQSHSRPEPEWYLWHFHLGADGRYVGDVVDDEDSDLN